MMRLRTCYSIVAIFSFAWRCSIFPTPTQRFRIKNLSQFWKKHQKSQNTCYSTRSCRTLLNQRVTPDRHTCAATRSISSTKPLFFPLVFEDFWQFLKIWKFVKESLSWVVLLIYRYLLTQTYRLLIHQLTHRLLILIHRLQLSLQAANFIQVMKYKILVILTGC